MDEQPTTGELPALLSILQALPDLAEIQVGADHGSAASFTKRAQLAELLRKHGLPYKETVIYRHRDPPCTLCGAGGDAHTEEHLHDHGRPRWLGLVPNSTTVVLPSKVLHTVLAHGGRLPRGAASFLRALVDGQGRERIARARAFYEAG
jgi:hypothetical protein